MGSYVIEFAKECVPVGYAVPVITSTEVSDDFLESD